MTTVAAVYDRRPCFNSGSSAVIDRRYSFSLSLQVVTVLCEPQIGQQVQADLIGRQPHEGHSAIDGTRRQRSRLRSRGKMSNFNRSGDGKAFFFRSNNLNLVESFSGEITLATVWASNHRNIFDQQQVLFLTEHFDNLANLGTGFSADVTD